MPISLSKLLPTGRNSIRRYHGTRNKYVDNILKEGLLVNPPNPRAVTWDDYPGVYTTVEPTLNYFLGDAGDALVILDLPKDWYRSAKRLPYNPEWPEPPPKPKRWDTDFLNKADDEFYELHGDEPGWLDFPTQVYEDYQTIVPIQQGGRVDIFKQDIPPSFIRDVIRVGDTVKDVTSTNNPNLNWYKIIDKLY